MAKPDPEVIKAAIASQRGMVETFFARLANGNSIRPRSVLSSRSISSKRRACSDPQEHMEIMISSMPAPF
jgi:hypothetical protein